MEGRDVSGIIQNGGTVLKTARSKSFTTIEGRKQAYDNLERFGIDGVVVIGGDGSLKGARIFSKEYKIPFVGIPGTIDNDLYGTDYTIGYDTCLNTVVDAVDKIRDTATSHNRIFVIEVMGKEAGWVALNSAIASGAESVLVPEVRGQKEKLMKYLALRKAQDKSSIVLVAEGESETKTLKLAEEISEAFPKYDVRATILGHIQRGGSPSCIDRVNASRLGIAAVEALMDDQKSIMVGLQNNEIVHVPLNKIVKLGKNLPQDLLAMVDILI
jgi:6-phosphofructokinase 1